jgi:N6-adenosine-specific RNA methylase IME4
VSQKTRDVVKREAKEAEREQKRQENAALVESVALLPDDKVQAILIDPPWDWGDEGDVSQFGRGDLTYKGMSFDELIDYPVGERAQANAHIYLCITNRSLPKGFALLDAWGFRYVTCITWCKPSIGMGNYFRGSTEQILFGVRGSLPLLRNDFGTWFSAPRGDRHSEKPEELYRLVESCSPGPWMELFSRRKRNGWINHGAEA